MTRFPSLALTFSLLTCSAVPALAGTTQCPENFAGGIAPTITNPKLQARTQEICFEAFAVLHSGISRTPLYSAEHLTQANLEEAKKLSRKDFFHAELQLPPQDRSELSDYARSGYNRGHMSPNADFANRTAQAESFSLANMVPQVHTNNAGIWAGIEGAARQLAMKEGEVYVVSGPAFIGSDIQRVGNVLVPTHLWKMLYSPKQHRSGAYVITNDETREYSAVTVSDLEKMVGIKPLLALPQAVRDAGMDLPKPSAQRSKRKKGTSAESTQERQSGQPSQAAPQEFTMREFSRSILDATKRATQR